MTLWVDKRLFGIPFKEVVLDVRLRFGVSEMESNAHTCIIVTSIHRKDIAFTVVGMNEVADSGRAEHFRTAKTVRELPERLLDRHWQSERKISLWMDAAIQLTDDVVEK